MKKMKWVAIVIVALGAVGIGYEIWSHNSNNHLGSYDTLDTSEVETNPWQPYKYLTESDSDYVFEVIWDQKYGATKTAYCKAIFKNIKTNQYELIAPWLNSVTIEAQNTNDLKINKVLKKDVPDYQTFK